MHWTVWTGRAVGKAFFAFGRVCTTYRDNLPQVSCYMFLINMQTAESMLIMICIRGGASSVVNWRRAGCSSREFSIPAVRGMVTARRSR